MTIDVTYTGLSISYGRSTAEVSYSTLAIALEPFFIDVSLTGLSIAMISAAPKKRRQIVSVN